MKALDWETTHRKWTGDAWQLDFAALDISVKHFLDRGYSVTVTAARSIFLSDYDAPFLEAHVPADPRRTATLSQPTATSRVSTTSDAGPEPSAGGWGI